MRLPLQWLPAARAEGSVVHRAPCRCIATSFGARVARLRCPILRTGKDILAVTPAVGNRNLPPRPDARTASIRRLATAAGSPESEKRPLPTLQLWDVTNSLTRLFLSGNILVS